MGQRRVCISHQLLTEMITKGYWAAQLKCTEGLPEGAKLVGSTMRGADVDLIYEHPDWGDEILVLPHNIPEQPVWFNQCHRLDKKLEYQDRGVMRQVAFVNGIVSTDWPSKGTIHGMFVAPLEYDVEELT